MQYSERDSNPHDLSATAPSTLRVYHSAIRAKEVKGLESSSNLLQILPPIRYVFTARVTY